MNFTNEKNILKIQNKVESDRYDTAEPKIFHSIKSYDEKTAENYQNYYAVEKRIVSKMTKISIPNCNNNKLKPCIKIVSKFDIHIYYIFGKINRQTALLSGRVGTGRFMVLKNSASFKMVIKI